MLKAVLAERLRRRPDRARASVAVTVALVGLTALLPHIGTSAAELKLLPPDEAFRFAARALDTRTIEANFRIAPGYYMYRDKMRFAVEPDATLLGDAALPPGQVKDDEFFGRVETYRDRVVVRLPMANPQPGRTVTLRAESQGCADAGVCYPPHTQRVTLVVPGADGKPGALVEAPVPKKSWFR
jgi:thiol:disulfide interchange protein DsbD